MSELNAAIYALTNDIHARNVKAGWWTDIKTGESLLETRSRPEMLKLVDSEVSEADHGVIGGDLMDDKLPHLPMFNVELADVVIRLADMIGGETSLHGELPDAYDYESVIAERVDEMRDASHERRLLNIINETSAAMEHIRKGRVEAYRYRLSDAFATTVAVAQLNGFDLFDVVNQKIAFNATRADHKIENRLKDDGKKF